MSVSKAGWAEQEITPPLGLPMGGRGPRFAPGTHVLDPLMASAIFLEDAQGQRLLLVSMDLIGLSLQTSTGLRFELSALLSVPFDAVILNFAHVHSGPMTNLDKYAAEVSKTPEMEAYDQFLVQSVLKLAHAARSRLTPVDIAIHNGRSEIGINRRNRNEAGIMGLNPNAAGRYNPDLWVLDLKAQDSDARCIAFSYGCHPVLVYGYAWDGISADYVGVCRQALKEKYGTDTHCQFFQGLAGNVRPRVVADFEHNRFRKAVPEDVVTTGTQLAGDICRSLENTGQSIDLSLQAVADRILLQRDGDILHPLSHWKQLSESDEELQRNLGVYWVNRLQEGIPVVQAVPWEIGLIKLSDQVHIAWFSGEPVAEWLGHLQQWLDHEILMAWGYCQDVPSYLPTDELIPEGGYEVIQSNYHGKDGPGPFAVGINAGVQHGFINLSNRLEQPHRIP